jgi:type III secretory pathway component EscU
MVNRLIGSLGDGPLWVLGPNGPVPVDPMAKDAESQRIAREAREARHAIVTNVRHLQKLGHEVAQRRAIAAQQLAPAMDPALATAVVGEAKEKSGVK